MSKHYYKAEEVRELASGHWLNILAHLAPMLEPAIKKAGKSHVDCPFAHGGKKDFRLFKDAHENGGAICTCGSWHDGFELLREANNWDFSECLTKVGDLIGAEKYYKRDKQNVKNSNISPKPVKVNNTNFDPNKAPVFKGVLIAHGVAPFDDNSKNDNSYFVFFRMATGLEKKIWGKDLERAINESQAQYGDEITLTKLGREAVSVMQPVIDKETGEIISEQLVKTHRNTWVVKVIASAIATVNQEQVSAQNVAVNYSNVQGVTQLADNVKQEKTSNVPTEQLAERSNVVPIFNDIAKPWLAEVQEDMKKRAERERKYNAKLTEKISKIWNECLPHFSESAEPLRLYLAGRKIDLSSDELNSTDCLRFHPSLSYFDEDGNEVGKFPAAVLAIRNQQGELVTLHRTYLTKNGKKAKLPCAKKMMPVPSGMKVTGGAVRLGIPTDGVLGLAEGLETALSGYKTSRIPTWSTVNATLLENFEVPEEIDIHTIIIYADKDKSHTGERSANALKAKLESKGYAVHVLLPKLPIPPRAKGIDWNDVLVTQGLMSFPPLRTLKSFIARQAGGYGRG